MANGSIEGTMMDKSAKPGGHFSASAGHGPDADCLPDSGDTYMAPSIFWGARIGMTIWFVVSIFLGVLGFGYVASLPMVVVGAVLYQGFNGLSRPGLNEATFRIASYSAVGILIVFLVFFTIGRLVRWLFV
ncbi:MAG: hypothetical protein AAGH82_04800 [Pseudomonadota bacterium]